MIRSTKDTLQKTCELIHLFQRIARYLNYVKKKQLDLNTNYVRTTESDLCIEVAVVIPVVKKVALRWVTTSCVKGIFTVTIGWD